MNVTVPPIVPPAAAQALAPRSFEQVFFVDGSLLGDLISGGGAMISNSSSGPSAAPVESDVQQFPLAPGFGITHQRG